MPDGAWEAFRSPTPTELVELLNADTSALPFLHCALLRHLEQFPSAANGLSRSERQILEIATDDGASSVGAIFRASSEREESVFLGDLIFMAYVRGLVRTKVPLMRVVKQADSPGSTEVEITPEGRAILGYEADHVQLNGIDRWLGGVRSAKRPRVALGFRGETRDVQPMNGPRLVMPDVAATLKARCANSSKHL